VHSATHVVRILTVVAGNYEIFLLTLISILAAPKWFPAFTSLLAS